MTAEVTAAPKKARLLSIIPIWFKFKIDSPVVDDEPLYERAGMKVAQKYVNHEKELRPGREPEE
jgi:hypothetical protein